MGWMLQKVFSYSQWSSGKWFFPILNESVLNWRGSTFDWH
jgi:hypothetical protein